MTIERRGARFYCCLGAAGGWGDTEEQAVAEALRRHDWYLSMMAYVRFGGAK